MAPFCAEGWLMTPLPLGAGIDSDAKDRLVPSARQEISRTREARP